MKKTISMMVAGLLMAGSVLAADIMVSWETNGVLVAEGMEPGSTGVVEAVSNLGAGFYQYF